MEIIDLNPNFIKRSREFIDPCLDNRNRQFMGLSLANVAINARRQ